MIARGLVAFAALAAATPAGAAFNAIEFFRGRTHGEATLKEILKAPKTIRVDSFGYEEKDGTLVVRQVINEPGKPARTRFWRLRQTGPGRYDGTLTDAASRVRIEQTGDAIRIRYRDKNHLDFDQRLSPVGPGQVRNRTKVKRFGITVAHLDEVIRKLD